MKRISVMIALALALAMLVTGGSAAQAAPGAEIIRDNYGVPHVYADTLEGLYFGFGYAAAQDRLFQMDMFRRTFWGRLSEVLGDKLLPFDQGNRRDNLSLSQVKSQIEGLSPEIQTVLKSYAAGINAYIKEALADPAAKLPGEYRVHGFQPEPWGAEDVAADFLSVMGFFMDVSAELANASVLNFLMQKHGPKIGAAMFDDWCWEYDPKAPTTVPDKFTLPGRARPGRPHPCAMTCWPRPCPWWHGPRAGWPGKRRRAGSSGTGPATATRPATAWWWPPRSPTPAPPCSWAAPSSGSSFPRPCTKWGCTARASTWWAPPWPDTRS